MKMTKLHALPAAITIPCSEAQGLLSPAGLLLFSRALSATPLAITQVTQQNQSVLNFSWDLGDLLMNVQRREKLTVLSYARCC